MMKKTLKMLGLLCAASFVGAGYASAGYGGQDGCCSPGATFAAKCCETRCITIGGLINTEYQYVHTDDDGTGLLLRDETLTEVRHVDPVNFNNFRMKHIRLLIRAELCNGLSGVMNIDFAGEDNFNPFYGQDIRYNGTTFAANEGFIRHAILVDKAYIEKRWCDLVFQAGYRKVLFGMEEYTPDECLKTIHRGVATNFFMWLGRRAVGGTYQEGARRVRFGGTPFGDRHTGLFLSGDLCDFHYSFALVNQFNNRFPGRGLQRASNDWDNELGYFASLSYEFDACDGDFMIGLNAGFQPDGANFRTRRGQDHDVWAFNPYILANWNCFSLLAEMFWGEVKHGRVTRFSRNDEGILRSGSGSHAKPWGVNLIPSYMINDCWEIVARFSYVNTNRMGTNIYQALGSNPNDGNLKGSHPNGPGNTNTNINTEVLFQKAASGYIGVNYYMMNQCAKASLGWEYTRFKHRFTGPIGIGRFDGPKATVNSIRAQLQLLF